MEGEIEMTDLLPSETVANPPVLSTQQEWADAWSAFNEGVRRLNRLAINDGITVKLQMRTLGWVPRGKKGKR